MGSVLVQPPATLILENGTTFQGTAIGAHGHATGEMVFNTSMTGYQEILTDPSYAGQMITFACPHIGNVGVNPEDNESDKVWVNGMICRSFSHTPSNWRATQSLDAFLKEHHVVGISNIDTRALVQMLRTEGTMQGRIVSNSNQAKHHVVVYGLGVKRSILESLRARGCNLTVVPWNTPAQAVLALNPDGIVLSNGPGDPRQCPEAIEATKVFLEHNIPIFGICLGHQILALACGAQITKLPFGHHGSNHPVMDLKTQRTFITSQNHSYAVDKDTLPACLEVTHISLFDQTIQGIRHISKPVMGLQGHPEASPGPHDMRYIFQQFLGMINYA